MWKPCGVDPDSLSTQWLLWMLILELGGFEKYIYINMCNDWPSFFPRVLCQTEEVCSVSSIANQSELVRV